MTEMRKKEFQILVLLTEQKSALTQREIAASTNISLGTVNRIVKGLAEQAYVADGRITDDGLNALEPYRVRRAVFLAAGFGSRLVPITYNTPKPLVRVNGTRMIDTLLDAVVAAQIPEIVIVRGYLSEQFDQLLHKYPQIVFIENPAYNESNNISSAMCARHMLQKAYVLESDLILKNQRLIRKYEYCSNFLGIPVETTDDWCFHVDDNGMITSQAIGGRDCYQMVGISYWDAKDGANLADDLREVYTAPGGKERYWEQTAMQYRRDHYQVAIRECSFDDVVEIDTYNELKRYDKLYAL